MKGTIASALVLMCFGMAHAGGPVPDHGLPTAPVAAPHPVMVESPVPASTCASPAAKCRTGSCRLGRSREQCATCPPTPSGPLDTVKNWFWAPKCPVVNAVPYTCTLWRPSPPCQLPGCATGGCLTPAGY